MADWLGESIWANDAIGAASEPCRRIVAPFAIYLKCDYVESTDLRQLRWSAFQGLFSSTEICR
jgi:hypothetical protein